MSCTVRLKDWKSESGIKDTKFLFMIKEWIG